MAKFLSNAINYIIPHGYAGWGSFGAGIAFSALTSLFIPDIPCVAEAVIAGTLCNASGTVIPKGIDIWLNYFEDLNQSIAVRNCG